MESRAYRICKVEQKELRFIEHAESLEHAQRRLKELKEASPGDYFIFENEGGLPEFGSQDN